MRMLFGIVALAIMTGFFAGCDNDATDISRTDRDNTAINDRDADRDTMTPFDQSNSEADTELVADLRSNVLQIDNLSMNGRNIKIITNDGKVVLRGPVDSDAERDSIVKVVQGIAGESNVTNQLEIDAD